MFPDANDEGDDLLGEIGIREEEAGEEEVDDDGGEPDDELEEVVVKSPPETPATYTPLDEGS